MSKSVIGRFSPIYILALFLLLIGFWIKIHSLLSSIHQIDEYISMLAAVMVAQHGLPILPSGLFYDHGLLLSFLSGGLIALLDFREEIARWPSLLAGVVTIAAYYWSGRALFSSRLTGLLAAGLVTFDELSVYWAGRDRMYTLAHLFVLLTVAWLLKSLFQTPTARGRYVFLLVLAGALLSHTVSFIILPPLGLLALILTFTYQRRWLHQPQLWLQAVLGLLLLVGVMLIVYGGQIGSTVAIDMQSPAAASSSPGFLEGFFNPGLAWSRFDDLTFFFFQFPYNWLSGLIGLGLLVVIYRFSRKQAAFAEWAFGFLALYWVLVILEMGGLLTSTWQKTRYLFILNLPAFLLLAAAGLSYLLRDIRTGFFKVIPVVSKSAWLKGVWPLLGLVVIVALMGAEAWNTAHAQSAGDYNTAFEFVKKQWQDGDKVMTVHPSAAYLYLGHNDYYANQTNARVLDDEDEAVAPVDRYTGAPVIDSVDKFNAVLAREKRVWLVVDQKRLYHRYEPFFTQQIFSQMNYVKQFSGVYVFLSEPFPRPLPLDPAAALDAQFDQFIRLEGYTLDFNTLAPDNTLPLHLYWRPVGLPTHPFKVFVQLRNGPNQTIAQADHFLLEGLLTGQNWQELQTSGDRLCETALLTLPLPLPANQGPYRLFIGLYAPDSSERVPLLNDTSGENAVVLPFVGLP
jgi:4-amino-4-deoxy-L-arabinose transferase-like glycosyltransferase